MVVSHDREFLDRVTTHTLDAAAGRPRLYLGGYTAYAERKAQRDEALDQQTEETRNAGREVAPEARLAPSRFRVEQKKGDKARAADRDQVLLQLTGIEVRRAAEGVEGTAVGVAAGAGSTKAEAVEAEAAAAEEEEDDDWGSEQHEEDWGSEEETVVEEARPPKQRKRRRAALADALANAVANASSWSAAAAAPDKHGSAAPAASAAAADAVRRVMRAVRLCHRRGEPHLPPPAEAEPPHLVHG